MKTLTWEEQNITDFGKRTLEKNIYPYTRMVVVDYPGIELRFNTKKIFNNNEERTSYLHKMLKKHKVNVPNHDVKDLIVEVSIGKNWKSDLWVVGS